MFFPVSKREPVRRSVVKKKKKERKGKKGREGVLWIPGKSRFQPRHEAPSPSGAYFNKGTKV